MTNFRMDVGEPLYLTPYIESGDIATGAELSRVVDPLDGIENDPFESYAGFFEVRPETGSQMFFWFAPATVSSYSIVLYVSLPSQTFNITGGGPSTGSCGRVAAGWAWCLLHVWPP